MNLQFSRCYIFVGLRTRNKVYIIVAYDDTEFWISVDVLMPIRMTLNDLE